MILLAACCVSCSSAEAQEQLVPYVETALPTLNKGQAKRTVDLATIVSKIPHQETYGSIRQGLGGKDNLELKWPYELMTELSRDYQKPVQRVLAKYGLMPDKDSDADYLLKGAIVDSKTQVLAPTSIMSGKTRLKEAEAWVAVEWEIYSVEEDKVVKTITTEGYSCIKREAMTRASKHAAQNLLAHEEFQALIEE